MRVTKKVRDGYTVTVIVKNEPSEEAILECRKAITKLIYEKEAIIHNEEEKDAI